MSPGSAGSASALHMRLARALLISRRPRIAVSILIRLVAGAFRPSVLTALVGVSGAGKTTLMDVLAGRKTGAPLPRTLLRQAGCGTCMV